MTNVVVYIPVVKKDLLENFSLNSSQLSPLARTSPVSLIFQHTLNVEREKAKFQNLTLSHVTKDAIAFEIGLIAIAACCVLSVRL